MRRLHDVFQARLRSLQKVRAKLSSQVAMLAGSQRLGHGDYSRIFASIQTLNHTVALEQKLRHECTMLTCSNFTAYQVGHLAHLRAVLLLSPRNQSCQMPHDLWGMLHMHQSALDLQVAAVLHLVQTFSLKLGHV